MNNRMHSALFLLPLLAAGAFAFACGGPESPAVTAGGNALNSGEAMRVQRASAAAATATTPSLGPDAPVSTAASGAAAAPTNASMRPLVPTNFAAELSAIGLDVAHLPKLSDLKPDQVRALMPTFVKSTGMSCKDCHGGGAFTADTPHKRLTRHMWNDFVRSYSLAGGGALYCDSCHQGKAKMLDKSRHDVLAEYMNMQFVQRLVRADGHAQNCASCHGTPFKGEFLDAWEAH
jgi:hypothetical protein